MTEALMETITKYFKDNVVGMCAGENKLTVDLKDKTVVIKDYDVKTIVEIIKEIEEAYWKKR